MCWRRWNGSCWTWPGGTERLRWSGVSLGGTIAREIARRRPASVSRVITLGSPVRLPVVVTRWRRFAQAMSLLWDDEARGAFARPIPADRLRCR